MLTSNPKGHYHFLPGGYPYSSGVIADPGYEIIHVTLLRPLPYRDGFGIIEGQLKEVGRGRSALCAVELRSPRPFGRAGFLEFNQEYRALLEPQQATAAVTVLQYQRIGLEGESRLCVEFRNASDAQSALAEIRKIAADVELLNVVEAPCLSNKE